MKREWQTTRGLDGHQRHVQQASPPPIGPQADHQAPDLPATVLYLEWLGGETSRKVLDSERKEHVLTDAVVQSHYKVVSGPQAKELIEAHWAKDAAEPQAPVRKSDA